MVFKFILFTKRKRLLFRLIFVSLFIMIMLYMAINVTKLNMINQTTTVKIVEAHIRQIPMNQNLIRKKL